MFKFCPSCSSKNIDFKINVFRCPDCGLVYYHNTAAASGCLIVVPQADGEERFVFLVRGKEPAAGKLDLPGGFVDPGEGILEGLYRELKEEIGWAPVIPKDKKLADVFLLFASFPNIYSYKGFDYNTCDMYFTVSAPGLTPQDLRHDKNEIAQVRFIKQQEINFDDFAFESTKRAVKAFLKTTDNLVLD